MSAVLLTRRDDLGEIAWGSWDPGPAAAGSVVVEVEALALTANTFTYGLLGDTAGYWGFYPVDRPGWGCLPAWGTGVVRESACPELPVGERLFGLLPLAERCALAPTRVGGSSLRDASPHRRALPPAYQHYERLRAGSGPTPDEQRRALLHPLFVLAFLLADELAARARPVVLTSASSRTAQALAQQLEPAGLPVVGLTAAGRVGDCAATGLFGSVLAYDDVAELPGHLPPGATTLVDLAGDAGLRRRIRAAGGEVATVLVGATHRGDGALVPDPGERVFSAVDRLRAAAARLGRAELAHRQEVAWDGYLRRCGPAVEPRVHRGRPDVERVYREVLRGRCAPGHAHLVVVR